MKKFIDGFNNQYEIYDDGRVYSHKSKKFLSLISAPQGYLYVNLSKNGSFQHYFIHVLVAKYFLNGSSDEGLIVHHIDGNKQNNHIDNLKYVTWQENTLNAVSDGKMDHVIGENHPFHKLTTEEVKSIRNSNLSSRELGRRYNVSHVTILNIRNNVWRKSG